MSGIVNAFLQGQDAAHIQGERRHQNALRELYQQQGAGIAAGNQNALNALAGFDPMAAMQAKRQVVQDQRADQQFQWLTEDRKAEVAQRAAAMNAVQRQQESEAVLKFAKMAQAADTPEKWDSLAEMNDLPDMVGRFDQKQMITNQFLELSDIIAGQEGAEAKDRYRNVDGKLVDLNAEGGPVAVDLGGEPSINFEDEQKFRKEFNGIPLVKDFSAQSQAFGRIAASAADPSAAGDLALIFNYMKLLDPGSVVREGEFATAQNSGGVPDRVRAMYNNVIAGERLAPGVRDDFVNRAQRIYDDAERQYSSLEQQYISSAHQYGIDPTRALPNYRYVPAPGKDDPPPGTVPGTYKGPNGENIPEGVEAELWEYLDDEQRALWQN